jgi:hypothetical protein
MNRLMDGIRMRGGINQRKRERNRKLRKRERLKIEKDRDMSSWRSV